MELLHFTGQVWRPPYEALSQLLQVTSGCTHAKCRFCTLYHETPFRLSPRVEIEADLEVIRQYQPRARRIFLTGGNPFALSFGRLYDLAMLIRDYIPRCISIGCFSRITDISGKSVAELRELRSVGFDGISIGVESGDDETLALMDKGYSSADIVEQCSKLDEAGIGYHFVYMTGLGGAGAGERNAANTAAVFNRLHPSIVNCVSLTVFPESRLGSDIAEGLFAEASERERLLELRRFVADIEIGTTLLADTVSNVIPLVGRLPDDKSRLLAELDDAVARGDESSMSRYRRSIVSL